MNNATETFKLRTAIETTTLDNAEPRRYGIDAKNLDTATLRHMEIARWAGKLDKCFLRWTDPTGAWNTSSPYVCDAAHTIVSMGLRGCIITDVEFLGDATTFVDNDGHLVTDVKGHTEWLKSNPYPAAA